MWEATSLIDCIAISKKFERGAIYSTTPESSIAMLGPVLDGMRAQSQSYINLADSEAQISLPQSAAESASGKPPLGEVMTAISAVNMDNADEADPNWGETLAGNWGLLDEDGNFDMSNIFNSECIPCEFRLSDAGLEAFFANIGTGLLNGLSYYLRFWEELLKKQLKQLEDMLSLFDNTNTYMDLCAFLKFFTDFMCVPDIARILSMLMALMRKQSFEFDGIFDLLLQLVGPLFSPFLGTLVALVEKFISMVVKPIDCIIDAIQALIAKFDYNILFQNIDSLDKHIDMGGPKESAWLPNTDNSNKNRIADPRGDYVFRLDEPRLDKNEPAVPMIDEHVARRDVALGDRYLEGDFNMAGPISTWIDAEHAANQQAVDDAASDLRAVYKAGREVDGSDATAVAAQRENERAANDAYRAAIEKRDYSVIGRANRGIETAQRAMKSSLVMLIGFLREGAQAVEGFFDFIFDEFKKLMGEYVGGGDNMIAKVIKKNFLANMINMINSIYKAVERNAFCEEPEQIDGLSLLPTQQGLTIWADEDGDIHIEGDDDEIRNAVDAFVEAQGVDKIEDQLDSAGDRLKSLIEFTGDPVLDTSIARTAELLTKPVDAVFKCPLNITVAQTEQINQWIREVNT